mmetsp:Transcript_4319/g.9572  ORF Transcript_4319/g.9572 Transcript_4319/m.9572 type:complete len:109 (-) Transcript_4319:657-983(-)
MHRKAHVLSAFDSDLGCFPGSGKCPKFLFCHVRSINTQQQITACVNFKSAIMVIQCRCVIMFKSACFYFLKEIRLEMDCSFCSRTTSIFFESVWIPNLLQFHLHQFQV